MYYEGSNELYHHGILGQKWGVRRYQNPDGTLTDLGKKRYNETVNRLQKELGAIKISEYGYRYSVVKLGKTPLRVYHHEKAIDQDTKRNLAEILAKFDISERRESIAKQYYDSKNSWIPKTPGEDNYMSRDYFKNCINIDSMSIVPSSDYYMIYYDDGGAYGYHTFVEEGSISNKKRSKYFSLWG